MCGFVSNLDLLRTKLKLSGFQSVSTFFVGIPSDRILFPSERGDKTSFFQYMNPWSLTAVGQCLQTRRVESEDSAMGVKTCTIRTMHGFGCNWRTALFLTQNYLSLTLSLSLPLTLS